MGQAKKMQMTNEHMSKKLRKNEMTFSTAEVGKEKPKC